MSESLLSYNCTVSELRIALCNTAINIVNIEGGKIACVHTHNRQIRSQLLLTIAFITIMFDIFI